MNIKLTKVAKEKLVELQQNNEPIKMKITGYSWCGAEFGIVSEKQLENENSYNVEGIDIIVSEELEGAVKGAEVDYQTGFFKKGFEIKPLFS